MEMNSNNLTSKESAMYILRIKDFIGHLHKITLVINRESFMTLGNTEYSQNLAKQTTAKLNIL